VGIGVAPNGAFALLVKGVQSNVGNVFVLGDQANNGNLTVGAGGLIVDKSIVVNGANIGGLGIASNFFYNASYLSSFVTEFQSTKQNAVFCSSVQIQGSASIFSALTVSSITTGLLTTGSLSASNILMNGSTSISTVAVTNTQGFAMNISSSTLQYGLLSTFGNVNIGGSLSTGGVIGASALGLVGDALVGRHLSVGSNFSVRGQTSLGSLTLGSLSTTGQAAFFSSVQIQGGVSVFSTIGALGAAIVSNVTIGGTLGVAGLATFSNSSNTGTLGVAGLATFSNTSNTGTLGVAGLTTLSNTSNTGNLGIAGATTVTGNIRTAGTNAVAFGNSAGATQVTGAVAIGVSAGANQQGTSIAIGGAAGGLQLLGSIAIGNSAGTLQSIGSIALGHVAGSGGTQGESAVAIGYQGGQTSQGTRAVAIGRETGRDNQGAQAVAIGALAGMVSQASNSVAIGNNAGQSNQLTNSVAIGFNAALSGQGSNAVAMGWGAGQTGQGSNAIAIGWAAGQTSQPANSIVLNASNTALNPTTAGFFASPLRSGFGTHALSYNTGTSEFTYLTGINNSGNIGIGGGSNAAYSLVVTGPQSNTGALGVAGLATFVNSSNTGTLGVAGQATFVNSSNTGTLGVAGLATFVNSSNTGTLGVAGSTTLGTLSTIGQAAFFSSVQIQGGLSVFSSIGVGCNLTVGGTTVLTGNVGIGKVPVYTLDVQGDINFSGILRQNLSPYNPPLTVASVNAASVTTSTLNIIQNATIANTSVQPMYLVLGASGTIYTGSSTVGMTPVVVTAGGGAGMYTAFYTGTTWYLGGTTGSAPALYTTSNVAAWGTNIAPAASASFPTYVYTIAYNGSYYLIGGGEGIFTTGTNSILKTTNFLSFTTSTGAFPSKCSSLAWNGALWVAVGLSTSFGETIKYSYDGTAWTTAVNAFTASANSVGTCVVWGGIFVAGAAGNDSYPLKYSYDGILWYNTRVAGDIYGVAWSGKRFVAVQRTAIFYSDDGISWTSSITGGFSALSSAMWSGTQFVVSSGIGTNSLLTSVDGVYWASTSVGLGAYINSVSFSVNRVPDLVVSNTNIFAKQQPQSLGFTNTTNNLLLMSNAIQMNGLYADSDKVGVDCIPQAGLTLDINGFTRIKSRSTGMWVVAGTNSSNQGAYHYSMDGVGWAQLFLPASVVATRSASICWNGSLWLAIPDATPYTSEGGRWTVSAASLTSVTYVNKIIWTGSFFIAVAKASNTGSTGSFLGNVAYYTTIQRSVDGLTWTAMRGGFAGPDSFSGGYTFRAGEGRGVAFNSRVMVAVGTYDGTGFDKPTGTARYRIQYSLDHGLNWLPSGASSTTFGTDTDASYGACVATNGFMWVVGGLSSGSASIKYSYDGITYADGSNTFSTVCGGLAYSLSLGLWVAVGQDATSSLKYSTDGVNWTNALTLITTVMTDVAWNGSVFIATGTGANKMYSSADGRTWTSLTGGPTADTRGIAYSVSLTPDLQVDNLSFYGKGQPFVTSTNSVYIGISTVILNNVLTVSNSNVAVAGNFFATSFSGNGAGLAGVTASIPGINSAGSLGINRVTASPGYAIDVSGNMNVSGSLSVFSSIGAFSLTTTSDIYAGGEVTAYSDVRLKDNIVTIDSALDKIMRLRGVYYTRRDFHLGGEMHSQKRHVGVIAQEIEEVLPEVVLQDGNMKSVAYGNIVALLIEGIKELAGRLS
jgi:hypothetical protein